MTTLRIYIKKQQRHKIGHSGAQIAAQAVQVTVLRIFIKDNKDTLRTHYWPLRRQISRLRRQNAAQGAKITAQGAQIAAQKMLKAPKYTPKATKYLLDRPQNN